MSNDPKIPVLYVGNADPGVNNKQIGLGSGRAPLVLGGEAQLLTQDEYDTYPSKLGVVFQKEGSDVNELTAPEIKEELEQLGVDFKPSDKKDALVDKLVEARSAALAQASTPPATDAGSQLGIGDNQAINPPSL